MQFFFDFGGVAASSSATSSASGNFVVQVGAVSDQTRAQQYQQRGTIKYVWTTSGPEPVDYQQSPLDYDHYLTKQLQPVAEGILPFVNDDFATIVTGQLGLF